MDSVELILEFGPWDGDEFLLFCCSGGYIFDILNLVDEMGGKWGFNLGVIFFYGHLYG